MANENKDSLLEGAIETTAGVELPNAELIFNIIKTHRTSLNAQITDNYIENNTALQDHIAFSPIIVTLSGLVGENVLTSAAAELQTQEQLLTARAFQNQILWGDRGEWWEGLTNPSSPLGNKLNTLSILTPASSNITQLAKNAVQQVYTSARRYIGAFAGFFNRNTASLPMSNRGNIENQKLQYAYDVLQSIFYNRKACVIHTPWKSFQDMYIQSIEITQDDVNHIMDVSVTFKQLKFASVQYGKVNEQVRASYNAAAAADLENNGKAQTNSISYERYTPGAEYVNQR